MSGTDTAVWLLACYGVTFLICGSHLLAVPRHWIVSRSSAVAQLLACYFCTGFWVALGSACWLLDGAVSRVQHGLAGATTCYLLDAVIRRLEAGDGYEFDERSAAD